MPIKEIRSDRQEGRGEDGQWRFVSLHNAGALSRVRSRAPSILTATQMNKARFMMPEQIFASVSALAARPEAPAATPNDTRELLTAKEVQELIRIDIKTIYGDVQRGLIPYVRIQSNLRFVKSEILAWVAEHGSEQKRDKRKAVR